MGVAAAIGNAGWFYQNRKITYGTKSRTAYLTNWAVYNRLKGEGAELLWLLNMIVSSAFKIFSSILGVQFVKI